VLVSVMLVSLAFESPAEAAVTMVLPVWSRNNVRFTPVASAWNVSLSGSTFSQEISADNIPNGRWVSFVAEDRQKLRSVVRGFLLDRKPYPGKLNILAFGADKFNGAYYSGVRVPDLSFAAVDASRFTEEIIRFISPSYSSYLAKSIDGNKATGESLFREIEGIASKTKKRDTLILFFARRMVRVIETDFRFCCQVQHAMAMHVIRVHDEHASARTRVACNSHEGRRQNPLHANCGLE
jgi:hypothetical protein